MPLRKRMSREVPKSEQQVGPVRIYEGFPCGSVLDASHKPRHHRPETTTASHQNATYYDSEHHQTCPAGIATNLMMDGDKLGRVCICRFNI